MIGFGSLNVATRMAFGKVRAGDGLQEGHVAVFVVGFEFGGRGAGFVPDDDDGDDGHLWW